VIKNPNCFRNRKFITILTFRHWFISSASLIQSKPSHSYLFKIKLILSSSLHLYLPRDLFPWCLQTKILCAFYISHTDSVINLVCLFILCCTAVQYAPRPPLHWIYESNSCRLLLALLRRGTEMCPNHGRYLHGTYQAQWTRMLTVGIAPTI
jgi:hypothetical protein